MKIYVSRKEHPCAYQNCACGKVIHKREVYIGQLIKTGDKLILLRYHPECIEQVKLKELRDMKEAVKERQDKLTPLKPPGRVPKILDPVKRLEANKLRSLRCYHSNLGHTDQVDKINKRLKKLEES